MSHYEIPRVVLGGTTEYWELCCESLCGIMRGLRYKINFLKAFFQRSSFKKIILKYVMKFTENQLW